MSTKREEKSKDIAAHRLYKAAANYVELLGGKILLGEGIQIIAWPGDEKSRFTLGIKCLGRRPEKERNS